jgi:hypothetical protein
MSALPTPAPSPDARAEEIFAKTRAAFAARAYPAEIKYTIRVSGLSGSSWHSRSYQAYERWPAAQVYARSISDEETAHPYRPTGISIALGGLTLNRADRDDILGQPKLAPTYSFGLGPAPVPAPRAQGPDLPGAPRTIGAVIANGRRYDVRLAGEESVGARACWHLTLKPLGDPGKYRLRDLWVDEASYQTVRLRTDGNFTLKATGRNLWTVNYAQIGNGWYILDETGAPTDAGDTNYDRVSVQFLDVHEVPRDSLDWGIASEGDVPDIVEPD